MDKNKKQLIMNKIMGLGFVGYFLVLLIERILALSFSITVKDDLYFFSNGFFPMTAYIITAISVGVGTIILAKPVFDILVKTCKNVEYDFYHHYKQLIIGSMVLLVSGMMHTGYTIPVVQFVAYGLLIVSMIIRTIQAYQEREDKFKTIISLIYLVCFSMSIPVCYMTKLNGAIATSFYVIEFIAVFALIPCFGIMLFNFFKDGVSSFHPCPLSIMIVLVGLTIGLKWNDEINVFVLIASSATVVTYIVNAIVSFKTKKK